MDAVSTVVVTIDGQNIPLSTTDGGLTWSAAGLAPSASSYNLTGGYYPLTVVATYETGASTTISGTGSDTLSQQCRLIVKERVKPTIEMVLPASTSGAYLTTASQTIKLRVKDNSNGQTTGYSGVDLSTLSVRLHSVTASVDETLDASDFTQTAITGGYELTAVRTLSDANDWSLTSNVSDHDGNAADTVTITFTVDTTAPQLTVEYPTDNFKTFSPQIRVKGTTQDATSGPVTISVEVDGTIVGTINVDSNGNFDGSVTLSTAGSHTFVIIAEDSAGHVTRSNSKSVYYSDAVPVFTSVTLTPNPVDGGATYQIVVVVE